ncbi:MAG TPA: cytochrome b/b6 domain-containing protein [Longimicrobiales bacterium]|nr:cytochrome b/b6 domain-containing protein [Longimicrobiales bacterium]
MEVLRTATNPGGQNVLIGIGWDLVWLAVIASALFVVAHALFVRLRGRASVEAAPSRAPAGVPERVPRHSVGARLFHWSMSAAMLVLLVTAFVPVLGLQFDWVPLHWIAGLVLVATLVYHVIHALGRQDFWSMWMSRQDVREGIAEMKHALRPSAPAPPRPGKYPFDHKLYHHMVVVVTVGVVATGLLMMLRIDTPFWDQNPYLLSDAAWGVTYVVHGLTGVALIGLVTAHVYFAIRPERRWITWSMVRGWIDREHYLAHHDPERWVVAGTPDPSTPATGAVAGVAAQAPEENA